MVVELLEGEALMAVYGAYEPDVFFEEGGGFHGGFFFFSRHSRFSRLPR